MACMTSGASSVTLQSLYWRSSDNFSVPAESSRVNWCSPARGLEDEILESRSPQGEGGRPQADRVGLRRTSCGSSSSWPTQHAAKLKRLILCEPQPALPGEAGLGRPPLSGEGWSLRHRCRKCAKHDA